MKTFVVVTTWTDHCKAYYITAEVYFKGFFRLNFRCTGYLKLGEWNETFLTCWNLTGRCPMMYDRLVFGWSGSLGNRPVAGSPGNLVYLGNFREQENYLQTYRKLTLWTGEIKLSSYGSSVPTSFCWGFPFTASVFTSWGIVQELKSSIGAYEYVFIRPIEHP